MFVITPDFVFKQVLYVRFYTYFSVKVGLQIHISYQFIRKNRYNMLFLYPIKNRCRISNLQHPMI